MNFTRLIKAMAVVGLVSFGGRVLAAGDTPVRSDNFDGYPTGTFSNAVDLAESSPWTVDPADLSMITNDYVTAFGAPTTEYPGFVDGDETQMLALNTEGKDLTIAAATDENADAYVDTLLKVVGSDTAPTITDTTVQTAVYLDTSTTPAKLKAWLNIGTIASFTNAWVTLDSGDFTDGEWIHLQIKIDYLTVADQPKATFTVNGDVLSASGQTALPTAVKSKRFMESVAFRGTGLVDNFAVTQTARSLGTVTVIEQVIDSEGNQLLDPSDPAAATIGDNYSTQHADDLALGLSEGYLFVKWELRDSEAALISESTDKSATFEMAEGVVENGATYYAKAVFTNKRTVSFDANTGSGTMDAMTVTYNVATNLTANTLTKTGHSFAGWNTAANGSGTAYADSASVTLEASVTLYAQWDANEYTITFDSDGGSAVSPITQDYGTAVTAPADPTKTGYTFAGWSPSVPATMPESITVVAQWTINQYTVTFDGNTSDGGSMSAQSANYNTPTALTANAFTKTGYTFTGWNTAANGSGTAYADGANYGFTADVTLYAQWQAEATSDITFGETANLEITSVSVAGGDITVEFQANGTVNVEAPATATLWVKVSETLGGESSYVEVEATVEEAAGVVTGSFTLDASTTDSLFVLGLASEAPAI